MQLLLIVEHILCDLIFLGLELMNFVHILIFQVLVKTLFFFIETLNDLFSSDERVMKRDFEISIKHCPSFLVD